MSNILCFYSTKIAAAPWTHKVVIVNYRVLSYVVPNVQNRDENQQKDHAKWDGKLNY
tara:strand:+ start:484 stop:654 length:171 start_codon:yes stop_codon:yes gene_type:complete